MSVAEPKYERMFFMGYIIAAVVGGLILITLLTGLLTNTKISRRNKLSDKPSERDFDSMRITQRANPYRHRPRR